jgi:hypothetical protein
MVAAGVITCVVNYERGKNRVVSTKFGEAQRMPCLKRCSSNEKNKAEDSGPVTEQREGTTVQATVILAG